MVGRLVEQQQVGLGEQQPAQRDAAALAAGELGVTSASAGGQRSASIAIVELGVEVPGVGGVDLLLQPRELVGGLVRVVHRQLVEAVEQRLGLGDALLDVAAHILVRIELGLLLEQADRRARRQLRVAVEFGVAARP